MYVLSRHRTAHERAGEAHATLRPSYLRTRNRIALVTGGGRVRYRIKHGLKVAQTGGWQRSIRNTIRWTLT